MSEHKLEDASNDRTYFVIAPQLVSALCEDTYQLALWMIVKTVAGESGECYLSSEDLAALAMMSKGKVIKSRQRLLELGLLEGEVRRDPGYPLPVYHLRVPDLWRDNQQWREAHQPLAARIAFKKAQRAGRKADGASVDEASVDEAPVDAPPAGRSSGEQRSPDDQRSPGDRGGSPGDRGGSPRDRGGSPGDRGSSPRDRGGSPGDRGGSPGDPKKNQKKNPKERQERERIWRACLTELAMMMTRATYDTWLRTSELVALEDDPPSATIEVRDGYCVDWCSHRLIAPIRRTLAGVLGQPDVALTFRARDQAASAA